jgi:hypothetical protein
MERIPIATQEAQRKFLGATIEALAVRYIGCSARTYANWIKYGTTPKNIRRIDKALKDYAKKEAY